MYRVILGEDRQYILVANFETVVLVLTGSSASESDSHRCSGAERGRQRSDGRQRRFRGDLTAR